MDNKNTLLLTDEEWAMVVGSLTYIAITVLTADSAKEEKSKFLGLVAKIISEVENEKVENEKED